MPLNHYNSMWCDWYPEQKDRLIFCLLTKSSHAQNSTETQPETNSQECGASGSALESNRNVGMSGLARQISQQLLLIVWHSCIKCCLPAQKCFTDWRTGISVLWEKHWRLSWQNNWWITKRVCASVQHVCYYIAKQGEKENLIRLRVYRWSVGTRRAENSCMRIKAYTNGWLVYKHTQMHSPIIPDDSSTW